MVPRMSSPASPFDAGDPRSVERRDKALHAHRARLGEALTWLLADPRGLLYLARLVRDSEAVTAQVAFTADGALFREGKRSLGLSILNDLRRHAPGQLSVLLAAALADPLEGAIDDR